MQVMQILMYVISQDHGLCVHVWILLSKSMNKFYTVQGLTIRSPGPTSPVNRWAPPHPIQSLPGRPPLISDPAYRVHRYAVGAWEPGASPAFTYVYLPPSPAGLPATPGRGRQGHEKAAPPVDDPPRPHTSNNMPQ